MKLVFMGTPRAAVPSLESLINAGHEIVAVYTQPDRPSGRGNRVTFSPVKVAALDRELPVFQPAKVKTAEALDEFRSHAADVAVVVAYGRILPEGFLKAYPKGAVNVHFSLLPKYRGAAPVNWAIVNGEIETGVTTMKMDAGLDTGDILLQGRVPIDPDENAIELMDRLSHLGADLIVETLESIDSIVPTPQDHSNATLAPLMTKEDGNINWGMKSSNIGDRIRGFQPFPTSYTWFRGSRLTVWRAKPAAPEAVDASGQHGRIVSVAGGDLIVECGDGTCLRIDELQPEGKRRMVSRDFINGLRPQVGERFEKTN